MKHQLEVLDKVVNVLKQDKTTHSIVLMGSVAYGMATDYSDLDILVLCDKDDFITKDVDDVVVEIHYHKYNTMNQILESNPMDVYKYIYSKTIFDDGKFAKLYDKATKMYDNYITPKNEKEDIKYWLSSTKIKLLSAIASEDYIKASYLLATNTWKVLEGVWAINNKPMPPSSIAYNTYGRLEFPLENWFKDLVAGDVLSKADTMIKIIEIICKS